MAESMNGNEIFSFPSWSSGTSLSKASPVCLSAILGETRVTYCSAATAAERRKVGMTLLVVLCAGFFCHLRPSETMGKHH